MDLTFKLAIVYASVYFFVFSFLEASDNKLFQIVKRVKKNNPTQCHIVSYRASIDSFKVTCIDKRLNIYLYQIPITVDLNSSFSINENRYMNVVNGMDSMILNGRFLGRSIKNSGLGNSFLKTKNNKSTFPILKKNNMTLIILDNETAPELGPSYRVVVDHIKNFDDDSGRYTTRIIDCHHDAFIKISDGSSFSEMEKNYGPPGKLIPISKKSILYQYRNSVCGEKKHSDILN